MCACVYTRVCVRCSHMCHTHTREWIKKHGIDILQCKMWRMLLGEYGSFHSCVHRWHTNSKRFCRFIKRSEKKGQHKKGLHFHQIMVSFHFNCPTFKGICLWALCTRFAKDFIGLLSVKRKENTKKVSICIKLWIAIPSHFISFVPHTKAYLWNPSHTICIYTLKNKNKPTMLYVMDTQTFGPHTINGQTYAHLICPRLQWHMAKNLINRD